MGLFADEHEVYAYLGKIFELALEDDELAAKLREAGLIMRAEYTDPDAQVVVDMASGKMWCGADIPQDVTPTIQLFMKADDGHKFWLGRLNLTMALTKGQVRSKGPLPKMLRLLPLAKPLFARYQELVRDSGRPELLEV